MPADPTSQPRSPTQDTGHWGKSWVLLILGWLVFRALYAAVFPLDLAPDESYYWDWGRRLDIGYYSKPPMIGWLMGVAGWLGKDSMFVLKFFPGVLVAGGLTFVFLLGRDLFSGRAGFWAALLLMAMPANVALSTFFTIDPPLFLFWSASLWFAWRWWSSAPHGGRWALALGLSMGLGCLTKQIHLLFPLLLIGFVAVSGVSGGWRSRAQLVGSIGLSLLFLLPPLLWNARHGWITFHHTADELERPSVSLGRSLKLLLDFVGGQAALGGGLTWIGLMIAAGMGLRQWPRLRAHHRYLLLFFVPGFGAFIALSLLQRVEQNWPLVFYTSAAVLLAGFITGTQPSVPRLTRLARGGVMLGAVLAILLLAVPFVIPRTRLAGTDLDPTARVRGWRVLAEAVEAKRRSLPDGDRTFLVSPGDRYVASALAFYLPDNPRTYAWDNPLHPRSQYDIWGPPVDKGGWDALVIGRPVWKEKVEKAAASFSSWEPLGEMVIPLGAAPSAVRRYQIFLGRGFRPPVFEPSGEDIPKQ